LVKIKDAKAKPNHRSFLSPTFEKLLKGNDPRPAEAQRAIVLDPNLAEPCAALALVGNNLQVCSITFAPGAGLPALYYCMEANPFSAVRFTGGVAPHMRKQGCGRIINISSMSARTTSPNATDHTTA
jgi:hypothetical protein